MSQDEGDKKMVCADAYELDCKTKLHGSGDRDGDNFSL